MVTGYIYQPRDSEPALRYPGDENYFLAQCLKWGSDCGQAPADRFCASEGVGPALSFTIVSAPPVRHLDEPMPGAVCDSSGCDGYSEIKCQSPGLTLDEVMIDLGPWTEVFKPADGETALRHPNHPEYYLHWCGSACDPNAMAQTFCEMKGFNGREGDYPAFQIKVIGDSYAYDEVGGHNCGPAIGYPGGCGSMNSITCKKSNNFVSGKLHL